VNFLVIIAATLIGLLLWALLAPRLLWRTVIGWSYRDAYRNEPSAAVFGLYRLVALIGIVAVVATGIAVNQPKPVDASAAQPHTLPEKMWGVPAPVVVNRVVMPLKEAPVGLVDQPVLAYQPVDGTRRQPSYLFALRKFTQKDAVEANGLVGVPPPPGLVGLDTADLVVQVNGDRRCFPQQVVVREENDVVRIGVFYGQANPSDGSNAVHVRDCDPTPAGRAATSVLLPLRLSDVLGTREVQRLDGTTVKRVQVLVG
jgi:hypothetical protein